LEKRKVKEKEMRMARGQSGFIGTFLLKPLSLNLTSKFLISEGTLMREEKKKSVKGFEKLTYRKNQTIRNVEKRKRLWDQMVTEFITKRKVMGGGWKQGSAAQSSAQ